MKAITICQPWAWAIAAGHKIIENRPRQWHHRGPIAIHAGLSTKWMREGCAFLRAKGITLPERFEFGAVIAVARLSGVFDRRVIDAIQQAELLNTYTFGAATIGTNGIFLESVIGEPLNKIMGTAETPRGEMVTRAIEQVRHRWATGPYCLFLEDVMPIEPVPCVGQLGLWECSLPPVACDR